MKRLLLFSIALMVASAAYAFDPAVKRSDRIGVLASIEDDEVGFDAAEVVRGYLTRELRRQGFDAFNARYDYNELLRDGHSDADFYVELISGDASGYPVGGVGVGDYHGGVDIAVSRVFASARVRLYDGRTFQAIETFDVSKRATTIMPAAIGLGGRHVGLWVAVPFVQYARYRTAARAVAREAAALIAGASSDQAQQH